MPRMPAHVPDGSSGPLLGFNEAEARMPRMPPRATRRSGATRCFNEAEARMPRMPREASMKVSEASVLQ